MSAYIITEERLSQLADAIRLKAGTNEPLNPQEMVEAILSIQPKDNEGMDHMIMRDIAEIHTTTATRVGAYAFYENRMITEAEMPAVREIADYAFFNCKALETVEFGSLNKLGPYAFCGCTSLTEMDLQTAMIRTIYAGAFENSGITVLRLPQDTYCSLVSASAFYGTVFSSNSGGAGGTIYVPLKYRVQYESNSIWADVFRNERNTVISY